MHRRRKKRPNFRSGLVEVRRSQNGFGFTISGQQPCILSCIVANSPADLAGLRAGDFLISVNGLNVSKLPHEAVVQLIGNSFGTIRLAIAENYYSDSSDEDIMFQHHGRTRPKYPYTKTKINRHNNRHSIDDHQHHSKEDLSTSAHNVIHSPNASTNRDISNVSAMVRSVNLDLCESQPGTSTGQCSQNVSLEYRAVVGYLGTIEMPKQIATSSKLQTVKSCIRKLRQEKRNPTTVLMTILPNCLNLINTNNIIIATYPAVRLNYVSNNSDSDNKYFGLVTSAIYADGLMCNAADLLSHRKDVVISNSCHVFVIDTKLVDHHLHIDKAEMFKISCSKDPIANICLEFPNNSEYVVSLIRSMYNLKAQNKTNGSGSINATPSKPPIARNLNLDRESMHVGGGGLLPVAGGINLRRRGGAIDDHLDMAISNSPQPSNHSEITTTSSNSDSGIGFHNDCTNISDRILVVDFPGVHHHQQLANVRANLRSHVGGRPCGIINEMALGLDPIRNIRSKPDLVPRADLNISHAKSKSLDFSTQGTSSMSNNRLTVRAMPDLKINVGDRAPSKENILLNTANTEAIVECTDRWKMNDQTEDNLVEERPVDVPATQINSTHFTKGYTRHSTDKIRNNLLAARSCDDMMMTLGNERPIEIKPNSIQMSIDDITLLGETNAKSNKNIDCDHVFALPKPVKKSKKSKNKPSSDDISAKSSYNESDKLMSYKLSPKVFGVSRPVSMSFENLLSSSKSKNKQTIDENFSVWGSLQELRSSDIIQKSSVNYLEGTYSEPNLYYDETKQIANGGASPFKRWGQSSLRSRSGESRTPIQKRPSSLAASDNDVYTKSIEDVSSIKSNSNYTDTSTNSACGPTAWGTSFEKLLDDPAGLHAFAEFLKKEFSAENIYFWTACERYRQISNESERSKEAISIFEKHLGVGALEPVNIDSQARNTAQENLQNADRDLFIQAQKQIFNLMKFDSYQRFIRSELYKTCLIAESKNQPLPYPGDQLDPGLRTGTTTPAMSKLKKSLSNAEDRRRKSLLPWHRKARCKSKDRDDYKLKESSAKSNAGSSNTLKLPSNNSTSDIHSSRSSLSSFDAAFNKTGSFDPDDSRSKLCRVILSNGATTVVQIRENETTRELIERLLDKRGICYQAYEAFLNGNNKSIELESPSSSLAGKEVTIEQRVIFKLDLPNRKIISVKSKSCKALGDVLRPILHKYNYRLDLVQVLSKESSEPLDMTVSVTLVDGQRLQIVCKPEDWASVNPHSASHSPSSKLQKPNISQYNNVNIGVFTKNTPNNNISNNNLNINKINSKLSSQQQQITLDEITNKVFNELLQGKVDSHSPQQAGVASTSAGAMRPSDQGSTKSEDWGSETSSGIFGRLRRRESNINVPGRNAKAKKMSAPSKDSTTGSDDAGINNANSNNNNNVENGSNSSGNNMKKPLIAKWKAGVKLQVTTRSQNDDLLEGLKRAQRSRLEDQRGTEINFELPDFLKDKENYHNSNKFKKPLPKREEFDMPTSPLQKPQPAPRLSITQRSSPSIGASSVQNKILDLENSLFLNGVKLMSSRSETPVDNLNVSTQCIASPSISANSNTSMNQINTSGNHIYNSIQDENYADTTMVFNHHHGGPHMANMSFSSSDNNNSEIGLNSSFTSMMSTNSNNYQEIDGGGVSSGDGGDEDNNGNGPPPLPPKPKILPIKPSNWGQHSSSGSSNNINKSPSHHNGHAFKLPQEVPRRSINDNNNNNVKQQRNIYLDQPSSSFV